MCLSMFWHFLDVVWIGVFTFVYLLGDAAMSRSAYRRCRTATADGAAHGSLRSYLIGFGLSVILTAIPFWLVMSRRPRQQDRRPA